jgi:hypothetical protein
MLRFLICRPINGKTFGILDSNYFYFGRKDDQNSGVFRKNVNFCLSEMAENIQNFKPLARSLWKLGIRHSTYIILNRVHLDVLKKKFFHLSPSLSASFQALKKFDLFFSSGGMHFELPQWCYCTYLRIYIGTYIVYVVFLMYYVGM